MTGRGEESRDDEIREEMAFHLQEVVDALVAEGWNASDARREALRRYGDRGRHAGAMREAHRLAPAGRWTFGRAATTCLAEFRLALRSLRRSPGHVLTTVATLALVTGANLTTFGIGDALIFRPLAFLRDPATVHRVYWQWRDGDRQITTSSTQFPRYLDLQRHATSLSDVAVFAEETVAVGEGADAESRRIAAVSASYFDFFDARPLRGRFLSADDDAIPSGTQVAVLGYDFWRTRYAGRDVIGRVLRVGNMRATIVGIAPEGFNGLNDATPPAAFVPATAYAASTGTGDARTYYSAYKWGWVTVLARRAAGTSLDAATAEATGVFRGTWPQSVADNDSLPDVAVADPRVILSSLRPGAGPNAGPAALTSLWLMAVAMLVLLIGCANVTSLSLTRSLDRRREAGLKHALGAGAGRLALGRLMEASVLAALGGLAALAVAQALRFVLAPTLESLGVATAPVFSDGRTLMAAAVLVTLVMCAAGVVPVLLARRHDLAGLVRGASHGGRDGRRTRGALLVAQALLSVVLLVGAGLFVRSLIAVTHAPLGYDPERVVWLRRVIPPGGFDAALQRTLREDLLAAARARPEVESVAWVSSLPFLSTSSTGLFVPDRGDVSALGPFTYQATTPDYFRVMRTDIVRGRPLTASDGAGAPPVAVVSESMAGVLWPGREPLGQCLRMREPDGPCRTVVGIARDIVQRDLAGGPRLHYYVPLDQYPRTFGNGLLIRLRTGASGQGEVLRRALQATMPSGSYLVSASLADAVATQQSTWRMGTTVLIGFAALALVVAGVGLYGAVGHDIAQRRHEWAVRVALGADRWTVGGLVLGRSLRLVACGVAPGLGIAAALGPRIRPLLFDTSEHDPATYVVAASIMLAVAALASAAPAIRASRAEPTGALRSD